MIKRWKHRNNEENDEETKIISIEKTTNDFSPLGNKLYFYSDATSDSVLTLIRQIDELSKQLKLVQFTYNLTVPPVIELHICSFGGEVFPSLAVVDRIINNEIPVHTYCEGIVASASTFISCSGHKRFISKGSCMLIHQISGGLWGNYSEFKDEFQNLELLMKLIKGVYLKRTSFTSEKLDEILNHDLYMTSEDCLKYGLVDVIL